MYDGFFVRAARITPGQDYRGGGKRKIVVSYPFGRQRGVGVIYSLHDTLIFLDHFNGPSERSFKAVCTTFPNMIEEYKVSSVLLGLITVDFVYILPKTQVN